MERAGSKPLRLAALLTAALLALFAAPALPQTHRTEAGDARLAEVERLSEQAGAAAKAADFVTAAALFERALSLIEEAQGPEHADAGQARWVLAMLYRQLGDPARARPHAERSLAILEKALGSDAPVVADIVGQMALILHDLGDFAGAQPYAERSVAIREQAPVPDPAALGVGLSNLGIVLQARGDYARALPLYLRSVALLEKSGAGTPQLAVVLNNLGLVQYHMGDYAAAQPSYQRAIEMLEKLVGPTHFQLAMPLNNLAQLHAQLGRHALALPLFRRSLEISERTNGPAHPQVGIMLTNIGLVHYQLGAFGEAREHLERSLAVMEKALGAEHPTLAQVLANLSAMHRDLAEFGVARRHLERAAAIVAKTLGAEHRLAAEIAANLGAIEAAAGEYARAAQHTRKGLEILERALGPDHADLAKILVQQAGLLQATGDYRGALAAARRSVAILEKSLGAHHLDVGAAVGSVGLVQHAMGDYPGALESFRRSLAIVEAAMGPNHPGTSAALNNLALLYKDTGDHPQALQLFQRSLDIARKSVAPEHPRIGLALNNIAMMQREMGDYARAVGTASEALAIFEKAYGPANPNVALAVNNLAFAYEAMSEYARALPLWTRSLALHEASLGAGHPLVGTNLSNLGLLYLRLGEPAKALAPMERALALFEAALGPDHPDVARTLNNLANVEMARDRPEAAIAHLERSRAVYEKAFGDEHPAAAMVLANLGALRAMQGEHETALGLLERSLAVLEKVHGTEHPDIAIALAAIADIHLERDASALALPVLERALRIASTAGALETVALLQNEMRRTLRRLRQPELAIFFGKQAVNTLQELRGRLANVDRALQRSYAGSKEGAYRGLAELLIEQGRLPEGQLVLAMLKEEEFFDFIRRDATRDPRTTKAALDGQEDRWRERYQSASERLAGLGAEYEALRRKARSGLSEAEQRRRADLETELRASRFAFESVLGALMKDAERAGAARAREVGERGLANLRALQGTLGGLGTGVVAVHYVMGEEKLSILLTTSAVQIAREAPVGSRELNALVARFRRLVQVPGTDPLPLAQELHRALVGPIAGDLVQAGAQTLMVSLDGALRYLPLAALHDGSAYLVERYRIAIFTEAAKDKLKDAPQPGWRFAGLGLTRQLEGFSALPAVRRELEGIVRRGDAGVLPGEAHFDQAFTAVRLRDALDRAYPVLHLASHFVFQPGTESNSFLLLGDGNRLSLREMRDGDFDFRNVDLITLSACETAVGGGRDANGQEIEGFGALAQKQGARAVIATLWPVADESTGELMQSLYRLRESERLTKAEALRRAQLQLLRGAPHGRGVDAARGLARADQGDASGVPAGQYSHPFYWAPFILMGNWL